MAKLENLGAASHSGGRKGGQAVGILVRGDDVEAGGEQAVQERVWRGPVNLPNRPPPI